MEVKLRFVDVRVPMFATTAPEVVERGYRPWITVQVVIVAALVGGLLGVVFTTFWGRGPLASYEYQLWRWQAETTPGVLLRLAGVAPGNGSISDTEVLHRYFAYTTAIRDEMSTLEPDRERLAELTERRARYEKRVERILASYIDDAIDNAGLRETLPFFRDVAITWPPVEFELTEPPHVLVKSPRDSIYRMGDQLLRGNLTLDDIDRVEAMTDTRNVVSMVVPVGGLAAYPAIVRADRNYWGVVETAAHEWIHHYLFFYPLGQQWGKSSDATALNETVANIAGREIANIVHARNPMHFPEGVDGSWLTRPERTIDFNAAMRALRLRVDSLLAEGRVEEAEQSMEETRLYLAEHGIIIRQINQAYFAFYGSYADTAASSDPIGPKVERVWELTGDLLAFLEVMRDVTSVLELDIALVGLERKNQIVSQ